MVRRICAFPARLEGRFVMLPMKIPAKTFKKHLHPYENITNISGA
jgi:hypothetical protein